MIADPTLLARFLLDGAAINLPVITGTTLRPIWGGYYIAIECRAAGADHGFYQWCPPDELDDITYWMVTLVWALNEKLAEAV